MLFTFFAAFVTIFSCENLSAQNLPRYVIISESSAKGMLLDRGWKYKTGDSGLWADPSIDDRDWARIDPVRDASVIKKELGTNICWLRFSFMLDSGLIGKPLVLRIQQHAASEIYIDGKLLSRYGNVSKNVAEISAYNPLDQPLPIPLSFSGYHVLSVRICLPSYVSDYVFPGISNNFFRATIYDWNVFQKENNKPLANNYGMSLLKAAMFIFLLLIHLAFYFFYKKEKVNLFLSFVDICNILFYLTAGSLLFRIHDIHVSNFLKPMSSVLFSLSFIFLLITYYNLFSPGYEKKWVFKILVGLFFIVTILYFTPWNKSIAEFASPQLIGYPIIIILECLRVTINYSRGSRANKKSPITSLMLICLFGILSLMILNVIGEADLGNFAFPLYIVLYLTTLVFPLAVIMYIALEFGYYYRKLLRAQALRNKIALDLHDDLGSKLTTARMFLKNITNLTNENDQVLLASSIVMLETSINDMRQIMNELQTSSLIENGYLKATEELVNKINQLQTMDISLSTHALDRRLEQKTEYNLFRITQELITNTMKYADAKNVSLDILARDAKIVLMYEDNGRGFDPGAVAKGYGLKNIMSRVASLGGSAEFDSSPGNGFRSIIELPLIYARKEI